MYIEQEINSKEFWESYQQQAWSICLPSCQNYDYLSLGLFSEVGEVAGKVKKYIRGDYTDKGQLSLDIRSEIGDLIWYLFGLSTLLSWDWRVRLHPTPKIKDEKTIHGFFFHLGNREATHGCLRKSMAYALARAGTSMSHIIQATDTAFQQPDKMIKTPKGVWLRLSLTAPQALVKCRDTIKTARKSSRTQALSAA